jgi:hypothetical protein
MEALRQIALRKGIAKLDLDDLPLGLLQELPQLAIIGGWRKYMK